MEEINDWQPAVIAPFNKDVHKTWSAWERIAGQKIRVRPAAFTSAMKWSWEEVGCEGSLAFEIHPQDAANLGLAYPRVFMCEHQILTD